MKKIYQLDVFRIMCALMVFAFHCNMHLRATFSYLNPFVQEGAIFMVAFFSLSGVNPQSPVPYNSTTLMR